MAAASAERRIVKSSSQHPGNPKNERRTARRVAQKNGRREEDNSFRKKSPSLVALLKSCAENRDLCQGSRIHADLRESGLLQKDIYAGNSLISMYAKCGAVGKAQQVLDELPVRDVVSWNALMTGYVEDGQGKEALGCFQLMGNEGIFPNYITYVCVMKACGITQDVDMAAKIHDEIVDQGLLTKSVVLGSALIDMYVKCGMITTAQKVLDDLPLRDVVSWSALIAGYNQQGQGKEALSCFQRMCSENLSPSAVTYACILKACSIAQDVEMGKQIHDKIASHGLLEKNAMLSNALVDMYAKFGLFTRAQKVLDNLITRDVISWSSLIGAYTQQGQGQVALGCFYRMRIEGFFASAITYVSILRACGTIQDVKMGKRIHNEILSRREPFTKDVVLGTALVNMYVTCGRFRKAQSVLEDLPIRDAISWTSLIAGYTQHKRGQDALDCFQRMRSEGISPNSVTYLSILKACSITQNVEAGKKIHEEVVSQGLLTKNISLGNALVDMYAKCGVLKKAREVFDELPVRDVVSWNALIGGYAQQGQGQEALSCFQHMCNEDFSPDAITYSCVLKACGIVQDVDMGKQVHKDIAGQGMLQTNLVLGNALIDMYAKCGVPMEAQKVFDEMPVRDVVSWSSLIAGYTQQGQGQKALEYFQQMRIKGLAPDAVMYVCILKACGNAKHLDVGKQMHDEILGEGLLKTDATLGTALVDMYIKCGALEKAWEVFDGLPARNIALWTTLITGYAQHGQGQEAVLCFQRLCNEGLCPDIVSWNAITGGFAQQGLALEALDCFRCMQQDGTAPNAITFVYVLNACSHSGLVDEGQIYFDIMRDKYGITPDKEHYTCMVDLFGRAMLFKNAMRLVMMMPLSDYCPIWSALLSACQKWGNVNLGRLAFEHAVQMEIPDAATYVLMSNIYAAAGMLKEAQNIESRRIKHCDLEPNGRQWHG